MTNATDVEIQAGVVVVELDTTRLPPGHSGDVPLGVPAGECASARPYAYLPGRAAPVQSQLLELCDGDAIVVTADAITLG